MKRLITLILLAPALAVAVSNYTITSGSLDQVSTDCCDSFVFSGSGPGVTTSGAFGFVELRYRHSPRPATWAIRMWDSSSRSTQNPASTSP
jgi:hypothetical protein